MLADRLPASSLTVVRLGRLAYAPALELQLRAVDRVKATRDTAQPAEFLLLVEHEPPVVTVGRGGSGANVLVSREALAARGVELHESSRGGDVTYHGPGQLVAYPVIDLARHGRDVHRYLRDLEQAVWPCWPATVWPVAATRNTPVYGSATRRSAPSAWP